MNMYFKRSLSVFIPLIFFITFGVHAQNASEIVKKADQKTRGNTSKAEYTMNIIRPSWKRSISMKAWMKEDDYALILVTAPARDEGTAYLKRDNEIWNWVPSVGRVIKLPPSMMSQSWMGSDFTNDDLVKESSIVSDYTHELVGDSTLEGMDCYKIKLTPKSNAPVVWDKIYTWISKAEYYQLRSEFYDEYGDLVNTMVASDIKQLGNRKLPSRLEMIPADKKGHKTILIYNAIEFNEDITDRFFTVQNMRRVQ